ncbi:MAG TPA: TonB-dependent receptor [Longimicrobiaceae bacterium]|nr:TonB-dependent receptor [Longimicrobiaceae bacterium]
MAPVTLAAPARLPATAMRMTRHLVSVLPLLAALLAVPPAAGAQQGPIRHAGVGIRVVDASDAPIAGARVAVVGSGAEGVSSESGWVRLPGVQPGRSFVLVTRIGYRPAEFSLQVPLSGGLEVDVELEPTPVAVTGVTAVSRSENASLASAGFYRRRETGMGSFLTREDIEKTRAQRTSEIFRRVRGIRVVPAGRDTYKLQTVRYGLSLSERGSAGGTTRPDLRTGTSRSAGSIVCEMLVYLDGVQVQLTSIDDIRMHSIEALEVYRGAGEIPAEFRVTNASCGVVALWTRARS